MNILLEKALDFLVCPACSANPEASLSFVRAPAPALQCAGCRASYPVVNGVLDFLPDYHEHRQQGLAQWLMENRAVVSVYEKYFRPAFTRMGSPITYEEEMAWLKGVQTGRPVKTVLDLACGTGKYARMLNDFYGPDLVFAADISLPMLEQAVAYANAAGSKNILHIRADAGALPFKDNAIDRANCFGALHLFPDAPRAIRELGRTASEDAVFTCLTGRKVRLLSPVQKIFSLLMTFQFFDGDRLQQALIEAGFGEMDCVVHRQMVLMFGAVKKQAGQRHG
ncbi:MAG: methyltransferase domain-containing protein [Thermodesulfobacteriota bacterium]|nr:methyltransferase domain-containing protein [Thermodesulfobacteriota bacterium]